MFDSAILGELQGRNTQRNKSPKSSGKRKAIHRIRSKRIFDLVVATVLLIGIAPAMLVIAWLIRRDGGPVFFGHHRLGASGQVFRCWKFRTMVADADRVLHDLLAADAEARAEWERDFKLRRDPRITAI